MFIALNKKKENALSFTALEVILQLYIDNIQLFDDNKRFESEVMRVIAHNLLSITLIMLYFLHTDAII